MMWGPRVKVKLTIISGPHQGREFVFDGHDTLLVGRTKDCHFQLSFDDPYFSRRHFLVEINPPRCKVTDLNSRNGTLLNGVRVRTAEVADGDEIGAGHTTFEVRVIAPPPVVAPTVLWSVPTVVTPTVVTTDPVALAATVVYQPSPVSVPGYRLERELGRGAMGVVYQATREFDGLTVALKTILPADGASRKHIDRFLRECRILSQLQHPNIVSFQEFGEADGMIFLAMDLVDGSDIAARLRERGPEDARTAVRMVCQMLAGLAHAHALGFVHRDIKPSNILIGQDGAKRVVKVADFGLARIYDASQISGLTMQGEVCGTPAFMAPEQVTHYREVKPAADQYSAAATLYNMLTDRIPHDLPPDIGEQFAHIVTAAPVPIAERLAGIPPGLAAVIHKALGREPEERYPDVVAFRKELKRFA